MTLRPWHSFVGFGIALLFGLSGVTCLSAILLERDHAERQAVNRATVEENVRLSLWRMDSELAPLIANESTRPHVDWGQLPARFFDERPIYVRLHFQFDEQGTLFSPQDRDRAAQLGATREQLARMLDRQRELSGREGLASQLALNSSNPQLEGNESYSAPVQQFKGTVEWGARKRMSSQAADYNNLRGAIQGDGFADFEALAKPSEAAMLPLWIGDQLVLARRVTVGGRRFLQGAWLDWEALRSKLLIDVRDLLPNASLVEVADPSPDMRRMLASLPARIEPGDVPLGRQAGTSVEVIAVLVTAWISMILASAAIGGLLFGAVSLSERRGAFVSAVTHELRTPLTTFRMYTEMLSEGMIQDEAKKKRYLDTLKKEAIRLGHLVENVLSYARIERGRARAAPETVLVEDLLARFEDRLRDRAEQVDMSLAIEVSPEEGAIPIHVDCSAVEQILFNLVDNACKYAVSGTDRTIHVRAEGKGKKVEISVSDHGPGIRGAARRSLFSAFSKSAHQAANSAPGVGLGLALSRRLARSMGGDLGYDDAYSSGARLVLLLKRAGSGASSLER
jgi:signal transduction histidine kinase